MKKIEHLPINWVNGLKLTNRHFFETYYNMVEMMRIDREEGLTDYNYGFGESMLGALEPVELEVMGDSVETFQVRLKSCNGVTREGYHIAYSPALYGEYVPTCRLNEVEGDLSAGQQIYIVLSVNPYKLLPVGVPDPENTPLHHPYALPEISLQLVLSSHLNKVFMERNCLIAAKCVLDGSHVVMDEQFIPPMQRTCYSNRLMSFVEFLTRHVKSIYNHSLLVCRKNVRDPRRDLLVENTVILCKAVQDFYCKNIFELECKIDNMSPIHLIRMANVLSNTLISALSSMPEKEFEALLQYYNEWINVKPSEFMNVAEEVAALTYKHTNISESLIKVRDFVAMLDKLFKKISELEYVGLLRDNIIVSEEQEDKHSTGGNRSLSVWD